MVDHADMRDQAVEHDGIAAGGLAGVARTPELAPEAEQIGQYRSILSK